MAATTESCSIAQLDGSDIVYVARVAVPKIVGLSVQIGTRFPALPTSLGRCCSPRCPGDEVERVLAEPTRSGLMPRWQPDRAERDAVLREVRARGWAVTDEQLALGIRSVAAPLRDGAGRVVAAVNVNAHAAETPVERLLERPPAAAAAGGRGHQRRLRPARRRPARHRRRVTRRRRLMAGPCREADRCPRMAESWRRTSAAPSRRPCRGVLVADFSRVLAGPYATMLLADLGAEVVKVEIARRRRDAHLDPAECAATSRPTTWASTAASARSRSTCATTATSSWPTSSPAGPT